MKKKSWVSLIISAAALTALLALGFGSGAFQRARKKFIKILQKPQGLFIITKYGTRRILFTIMSAARHKERKGAIMKHQKIAGIFADASAFDGQKIRVCGWVRTVRDLKNFGFIELNDGSCFKSLQVVFERGALNNYDEIARQNVGAALIVDGTLVLTPEAKQPVHSGLSPAKKAPQR